LRFHQPARERKEAFALIGDPLQYGPETRYR
jgi:hypothetical protein